ncbi:MAG: hypothetical protein AB8I08_21135 [Sandaracinaceae bacterium]
MTLPIKSRHGLTRCGVCRAHIQAAERPSETDCPFCGANLLRGGPRLTRPSGRGGVLAASLLAFGLTACGAEEAPVPDPAPIAAEEPADPAADPAADPVADDFEPTPAEDNAAVAEYGARPDIVEPTPGETEVAQDTPAPTPPPPRPTPPTPTQDEPVAVPAYGVAPPDDSFRPTPSDDMRPTARYGMAPMRPPTRPDSFDPQPSGDMPAAPRYGGAPIRNEG